MRYEQRRRKWKKNHLNKVCLYVCVRICVSEDMCFALKWKKWRRVVSRVEPWWNMFLQRSYEAIRNLYVVINQTSFSQHIDYVLPHMISVKTYFIKALPLRQLSSIFFISKRSTYPHSHISSHTHTDTLYLNDSSFTFFFSAHTSSFLPSLFVQTLFSLTFSHSLYLSLSPHHGLKWTDELHKSYWTMDSRAETLFLL
jgi:hypothetical protein